MYGIRIFPAVCLAALLSTTAARAEIAEDIAQQIYLESGAQLQLEQAAKQFPAGVRQGFESSEGHDAFDLDEVERLARTAYDAAATRRSVIEVLGRQLSAQQAKDTLAWLHGRPGRKITQLEIAASSPEGQAKADQYVSELQTRRPPESRLQLIQNLDRAVKVTESSTQMALNMGVAVSVGMLDSAPFTDADAIEALREKLETERPLIQEALAPKVFVYLNYVYRDLSETELQQYIDFASSPSGAAYHSAMRQGIDAAMSAAGLRLGQGLGTLSTDKSSGKTSS